ncbi:hypothetical protein OEZ85_003689 [Tetradesmus obliquus]|uniref:Uncharacterized protein n=1 Tax=Tetradesmus obliquus TaxID=3088 RepID=A0ABY8UEG6_TETOB|nr:hypothetical protein OEZ85_003689 [Tetradesmus obliquus]
MWRIAAILTITNLTAASAICLCGMPPSTTPVSQQTLDASAEANLLLLITKASDEEQVAAALAAVRANHMKRQRIRQAQPHSPQVFSALLKAGQRAGLGHRFSLQLLQQVEQLGLAPSQAMCHEVLAACIQQQDYAAASMAWLYAKAHCVSVSPDKVDAAAWLQQFAGPAAAAERQQPDEAAAAAAAAAGPSKEYWASKPMVRLYAQGVARWLQAGGVSHSHKKRLQAELQELAQELVDRGSKVPPVIEQALQEAAAAEAAAAEAGAAGSGAAEGEGAAADGGEQPAADDGKGPRTA